MPPTAELTPVTASSAQVVDFRAVQGATGGAHGFNFTVPDYDPFVEAPMKFIDGLKAPRSHDDSDQQDEPVGSGPFGF